MGLFSSIIVASLGIATIAVAKGPVLDSKGAAPAKPCKDHLVVVSPNPKSIQDEFSQAFKAHYLKAYHCEIEAEFLYQGGASDVLRLVMGRFDKDPSSSGFDIFWGGGEHPHYELDRRKLLVPYMLPAALKKEVPAQVAGVSIYNKEETWHASVLSSFGIFFNKMLMGKLRLPEPKEWSDLGDPRFMDNLSTADLRRSSSNVTMGMVILQGQGWDKGWELLTAIAANTRSFTHSSTDPIKAVVNGDAVASISVGFYAIGKVAEIGSSKLGYVFPSKGSILNPDPISLLKGAKNRVAAERFVDFVLSVPGQKLFLLPKGVEGGPKNATLARMGVNRQAYQDTKGVQLSEFDPFTLQNLPMMLNVERVTALQFIFSDLVGATHIDTHKELKKAWQHMIKRGNKAEERAELSRPPLSEAEMSELAKKWNDATVRNKAINEWNNKAQEKYKSFLEKK
jgi:ABC-type Fe3+ transport system substrate-binding protein